jgi:hypothetical protein
MSVSVCDCSDCWLLVVSLWSLPPGRPGEEAADELISLIIIKTSDE